MKILVERAGPEDALDLIEVQNQSFRDDFEKYGECPSYQESPANMKEMIRDAIVYKITADGRMIGDVIIRKREDNSYYLRTIAILPSYQSLGIGTEAIGLIERENPGGRFWRLITPEGSCRNRHFYEKLGYRKVGMKARSERLALIEYQKDLE